MGDLPDSSGAGRSLPVREDCWSEDATATLIDSWGRRYLDLNRGNLRQKDWQDVADAVNSLHAHTKKTHRSDVQCKNRIDTIKKKYKSEKARVSPSSWIFFHRLDSLIGPSASAARKPSPPLALRKTPSPATPAVSLPQKRPAADDGYFRRHFSAQAAAAAAADTDEEEEKVESEDDDDDDDEEGEGEGEGMMKLARVIERFGAMYERVEEEKLRQMVELEKQRMQFAKDLEVQRMQMFIDTQVHLERIKREKRSASNGERKF